MALTQNGDIPQECLRDWVGRNTAVDTTDVPLEPESSADLNRTIENEIIPRLMMLFDQESGKSCNDDFSVAPRGLAQRVEEFVELILKHDADVAREFVARLRSAGLPLQSIYLDLLAPAARKLGTLWETDEVTFTMVTIGVARMHQVLLHFSPCFCSAEGEDSDSRHNALIVPAPGEQHTFGLFMTVEFFRRGGWNVWSGTPDGARQLLELVRDNYFDIVGLSVSSDRHLDELSGHINRVREQSCNKDIKVIVGGRIFTEQPQYYREVGADAAASDGDEGVRLAESLVNPLD